MAELVFMEKKFYSKGTKDVSITVGKDGDINITFRNETYDAIAPNTQHIIYAVTEDRIYFKETDARKGYKLVSSKNVTSGRRYLCFNHNKHKELYDWVKDNEGDYDLKWDAKINLWFVCKNDLVFVHKGGSI
jgi:hypothetical protein